MATMDELLAVAVRAMNALIRQRIDQGRMAESVKTFRSYFLETGRPAGYTDFGSESAARADFNRSKRFGSVVSAWVTRRIDGVDRETVIKWNRHQ